MITPGDIALHAAAHVSWWLRFNAADTRGRLALSKPFLAGTGTPSTPHRRALASLTLVPQHDDDAPADNFEDVRAAQGFVLSTQVPPLPAFQGADGAGVNFREAAP